MLGQHGDGRMRSLRRTCCGRARAREGPADEGPAGSFRGEPYLAGFSSSASEFLTGFVRFLNGFVIFLIPVSLKELENLLICYKTSNMCCGMHESCYFDSTG